MKCLTKKKCVTDVYVTKYSHFHKAHGIRSRTTKDPLTLFFFVFTEICRSVNLSSNVTGEGCVVVENNELWYWKRRKKKTVERSEKCEKLSRKFMTRNIIYCATSTSKTISRQFCSSLIEFSGRLNGSLN